jgi:hypothetical protein
MGIKIKDFNKKLSRAVNESVSEIVGSSFLNEVGKFTRDLVKKRTKLGKGVSKSGGPSTKLEPYKESYVKQRRILKKKGQLAGTPKKSNLTKSGEMLDKSLDHVVSGRKILVGMNDDESAKKAAFVSKTRPFLNLSGAEIKQIIRKIRDKAKAVFRKKLL